MPISMKVILLSLLSILAACSKSPECNYSGEMSTQANAGCMVVKNKKVLIIEGKNNLFQLPGGGAKKGEAAQCTAERETWEETGIEVVAGGLVETFENGFKLFDCTIKGDQILDGSNRPWRWEVKAVYWLGVDDFTGRKWRFPDQAEKIKLHLKTKAQELRTNALKQNPT